MLVLSLHISDAGVEARTLGGQAACIAAFFMSVGMAPSYGRPCGEPSRSPVPSAGLPHPHGLPSSCGSGEGGTHNRYLESPHAQHPRRYHSPTIPLLLKTRQPRTRRRASLEPEGDSNALPPALAVFLSTVEGASHG